jgi:hypothetical protein
MKQEYLTTPCDSIVTARRRNPVITPGHHVYLTCPEIERKALV